MSAVTTKHATSGHFLPSITSKSLHGSGTGLDSHLPSALPSGYTSSSKSSAHGTFLPSIYGDKLSAKVHTV